MMLKHICSILLLSVIFLASCRNPNQENLGPIIPEGLDIYEFQYDFDFSGSVSVQDQNRTHLYQLTKIEQQYISDIDPETYTTTGEPVGLRLKLFFEDFPYPLSINWALDEEQRYDLYSPSPWGYVEDSGISWAVEYAPRSIAIVNYENSVSSDFSIASNNSIDYISITSLESKDLAGEVAYATEDIPILTILDLDIYIDLNDKYYLIDNISSSYTRSQLQILNAESLLENIDDSMINTNGQSALDSFVTEIVDTYPDQGIQLTLFYHWLTNFLYYDYPVFYSNINNEASPIRDTSINGFCMSQLAVCSGFSEMLNYMCERAGFSAIYISGYTGSRTGSKHAWNAISINGQEYILDSTWDCSNKFENNVCTISPGLRRNFLKLPDYLVYSRYPDNPNHQFVEPSISAETYDSYDGDPLYDYAGVNPEYFEYDIVLTNGIYYQAVNNEVLVNITHPENYNLGIGGFYDGDIIRSIISPTETLITLKFSDSDCYGHAGLWLTLPGEQPTSIGVIQYSNQ